MRMPVRKCVVLRRRPPVAKALSLWPRNVTAEVAPTTTTSMTTDELVSKPFATEEVVSSAGSCEPRHRWRLQSGRRRSNAPACDGRCDGTGTRRQWMPRFQPLQFRRRADGYPRSSSSGRLHRCHERADSTWTHSRGIVPVSQLRRGDHSRGPKSDGLPRVDSERVQMVMIVIAALSQSRNLRSWSPPLVAPVRPVKHTVESRPDLARKTLVSASEKSSVPSF